MRKASLRNRTLLILSFLALPFVAIPALSWPAVPGPVCGSFSYVACNGDNVTVIELCDGGILEVINGKVTIYSDTSYDLEEADRIEYLSRDGHMWVLISNGNTAFCNR